MKQTSASATLVLACYQSGHILGQTLKENIEAGFSKIVIIDGESNDGTQQIVKDLAVANPGRIEFFRCPKLGLANARNIGTSKVNTPFTMHAGPDNIIPKETLKKMFDLCLAYDLVSCQTATIGKKISYFERAHKIYKKRFKPGLQPVVGTPYIAKTSLFKTHLFNEKMLNSDDTELCERLAKKGKAIYRSDAECLETGFNKLPNIIERWMRWGRGDALFYKSKKNDWTLSRKIKSCLHPFKAEIFDPWNALSVPETFFCLPFLILVTTLRYSGWIRYLVLKK